MQRHAQAAAELERLRDAGPALLLPPPACLQPGQSSQAERQFVALTDPDSPAYLPGFFQIALGSVLDSPKITAAARTGAGFGWGEHGPDVLDGCERFFRPGYNANLTSAWLPALDGAQAGEARIRDVVTAAGFTRFRRAAETPFNLVFEARP
jgi:hypothetical protein